ncbi:ATP-binding cassette domain-containing protein [Actinopolymorpha alba]|uniref:ATP-binding cassette domain-containing protein n=1 Tax=Actinopolymorpha alba TaxID=533267 RepID=UPI00035C6A54|nr:ABC transporter ATP-binding protein [Actinopolymorpha alba]
MRDNADVRDGTGEEHTSRPEPAARQRSTRWLAARRTSLRRWCALGTLLWRAGRWRTAGLAALILLKGLLPTGIVLATGLLAAALPDAIRDGLESPAGRQALLALSLVVAGFTAGSVVGAFADYAARALDDRYALAVHEAVVNATVRTRTIEALEDPSVAGEIAALEEVERADGHLTTAQNLRGVLEYRIGGVAAAVVVFTFAWWAPFVLLTGWVVLTSGFVRWVEKGAELGAKLGATRMRRSRYVRNLAVEPAAAKEIRVFGLADWLVGRYADTWTATMREIWQGRRHASGRIIVSVGVLVAALGLVFGWLGWSVVYAGLSPALVVVYAQAILNTSGFGVLGDIQWATGRALVASSQVLDLERRLAPRPSPKPPPPSRKPAPAATATVNGRPPRRPIGIRFDGVRFGYRGRPQPVLDGLDLTVPPGQSLAIVGENGAGKTTLIKLLCGLYEPTAGRILLDDGGDPEAARQRIGAIFQEFVRYELSLRHNVAFGNLALTADDAALEAVLRDAGGSDLLAELRSGWGTVLSRGYDGGQDLSGGQWQKVALARALAAVRGGAGLLILDEPTAALDVRAETELFDRFLELTRDVTTILVSHRLASVRHADRIVVIAGGRVAEDGTHAQLMADDGAYARMFTLQASRFAVAGTAGEAADA